MSRTALGDEIRGARRRKGYRTQAALVDAMHEAGCYISPGAVSMWERGKSTPNETNAAALYKVLGVVVPGRGHHDEEYQGPYEVGMLPPPQESQGELPLAPELEHVEHTGFDLYRASDASLWISTSEEPLRGYMVSPEGQEVLNRFLYHQDAIMHVGEDGGWTLVNLIDLLEAFEDPDFSRGRSGVVRDTLYRGLGEALDDEIERVESYPLMKRKYLLALEKGRQDLSRACRETRSLQEGLNEVYDKLQSTASDVLDMLTE